MIKGRNTRQEATASAAYNGCSLAVAAEASRVFPVAGASIEPMVGLSAIELWRPDFTETGAGARLQLSPISSVMIAYDGELASHASVHAIEAGATLRW
jgi:uncharacterized protein with beta-barrel porin domain